VLLFFITACGNNDTVDAMGNNAQEISGIGSVFTQERGDAAADPITFLRSLTTDMYTAVLNSFSDSTEVLTGIADTLSGEFTVTGDFLFSVQVSPAQVNRWMAEFPELNELRDVINLLLNSGINMEMAVRVNGDTALSATLAWVLEGQRVLGVDVIMLDDMFYVAVPELYNRYIAFSMADLGLDMGELMWLLDELGMDMDDMLGDLFGDVFDDIAPLMDILAQHEATIDRVLGNIIQAALDEFKTVRVNNGVTVNVNNRPVVYNEIEMAITELELVNAARISLQLFRADANAVDMTVSLANAVIDMVEPPHRAALYYITAQELRDALDELIDELNPVYFTNDALTTLHIYLDAATNAPRGAAFTIEGMAFRFFFDSNHGYEISVIEEGGRFPSRFVLRGSLSGNAEHVTGDMWIEVVDNWTNISGKLGSFDIRYTAWDNYSITLQSSLRDWFALAGVSPNDLLIDLFADYLNNAELIVKMEAANNKAHVSVVLQDAVNGLSISMVLNTQENVPVTITAPTDILSLDDIDVLLGRDLFTIMGNVGTLMERIESMGYDISILDMLLMELF
jgi:hypothetical protein